MKSLFPSLSGVLVAAGLTLCMAQPALSQANPLRAGAAKIDVTPKDLSGINSVWSKPFTSVHDPIYVRAVVVDNGTAAAAMVATDLVENGDTLPLRQRIQKETGIAADHILITASHDHNAPRSGPIVLGTSSEVGRPASPPAYAQLVDDSIVQAVKQAKSALQPARVGTGVGRADVNVNRIGFNGKGWGGADPDAPSDKSVWVVKFETLTGEPIALLVNYAVHSVISGAVPNELSGDVGGAVERYVEKAYNGKAVALWSMSAAGDQNPKIDMGFGNAAKGKDPVQLSADVFNAIDALGTVVGAEAVRTANGIKRLAATVRIAGGESVVTCKNRQPEPPPANAAGGPPKGSNMMANPTTMPPTVDIRLGLVLINQIALTGVNGELFTGIGQHIRKETPLTQTVLMTMANGRVGYIADDASYMKQQRNVSLEQGCAEEGIVNGLVELIQSKL